MVDQEKKLWNTDSIPWVKHCAGKSTSKLNLQWQLHVSLSTSIIKHYKPKWMLFQIENGDKRREILWNTDSIPRVEHCEVWSKFKLNCYTMAITYFFVIKQN
jgi:hypothetical protein